MDGLAGAQQATRALLEAHVPARVAAIEERHGWGAGRLELPRLYAVRSRVQMDGDAWPAVIVDGRDTLNIERVDLVDGSEVYAVTYRLRVLGFVRGGQPGGEAPNAEHVRDDHEDTTARRDELILAIREALLAHRALDLDGGTALKVDERSLVESYSEVMPDEVGRSIAAGYVELSVIMEERLHLDGLAEVATTILHPALMDD